MIRFTLVCGQAHEFEGWFKNSQSFDAQEASGDLSCPVCGDTQVRKGIMAPAIGRAGAVGDDRQREMAGKMREALRAVRAHVEANFDDVGERFPEEVRKMHYGEAEHRDVYGKAAPAEAKALVEEGIPIRPLPSLPKLDG